jgi:hypothetical protein
MNPTTIDKYYAALEIIRLGAGNVSIDVYEAAEKIVLNYLGNK